MKANQRTNNKTEKTNPIRDNCQITNCGFEFTFPYPDYLKTYTGKQHESKIEARIGFEVGAPKHRSAWFSLLITNNLTPI
jgi:hypothetical protein